MDASHFSLPPFRFDAERGVVWRGRRAQTLRPRAAALLRYLLERPGDVVTPDEVLAALWPGVRVEPGVVKVYVWEIRRVLRDRSAAPRFLETVARRGYRWIAPVTPLPPAAARDEGPERALLVGRDAELAALDRMLEAAARGERGIVLVSGEAGIGKTALVDRFVRGVSRRRDVDVVAGHCIEHSGPGEAYLPLLAALGRIARGARRRSVAGVLARHAPTWLVQLPSLLDLVDAEAARAAARDASRERMLREIAEAMEVATRRRTLVLLLEDLQWSDPSTLDVLALLARRDARARLLVVGTFRPADAAVGATPLRALALHECCTELRLGFLAPGAVAAYVRERLAATSTAAPDPGAIEALARAIHQRTEGSPLFMVNVVDDLLEDRALAERPVDAAALEARVRSSVPATLRAALEARIERLDPADRTLLEAASAVGARFSAAAVAAALEQPVEDTERRCAELARHTALLEPAGTEEWPDGTAAARFAFVHALYQGILEERLTAARRRALHQRIGERLERGHGAEAREIAAALALHFERGSDLERAQTHLGTAVENALRRHANAEAARHLERALALLARTPAGPDRDARELTLQVQLGAQLLVTQGYTAPKVSATYGRAMELCRIVGEGPQQLLALAGIYRFSLVRSELRTAAALAEQVLDLARRHDLTLAHHVGHVMLGITCFGLGELAPALEHLEEARRLHDPDLAPLIATSFGDDPRVVCLSHTAMVHWFLGRPDRALACSDEALAIGREVGVPHSMVFALNYAVWCRLLRREGAAALRHADELVALASEHGLSYWVAQGAAVRGWALLDVGEADAGVAEIRRGLGLYEAIGAEVMRPWHLVRLAEAYGALGRLAEARAAAAESRATMQRRDERFYEAELCRVEGELARAGGDDAAAEERFRAALATARGQGARSLELRAALSLARMRSDADARASLAQAAAHLDEGLDTGDVRAARTLLSAHGQA